MSETTICFEKTGEFRLPHPFEYWLFEGEVLHGISPAGPDQRREILQRKDMPNVTTLLATAKASNTTLRAQLSTLAQQLAASERELTNVLSLVRSTFMEHGLCEPRSRKACSACNARDKLREIIEAWKGPKVTVCNANAGSE